MLHGIYYDGKILFRQHVMLISETIQQINFMLVFSDGF
jgi:hypothetical protein